MGHCNQVRDFFFHRFKEQKRLEEELDKLKIAMEKKNVDDDVYRQYFLTMCKSFASQALDELSCLDSEKPLLAHRAKVIHLLFTHKKVISSIDIGWQ